MNIIFESKPSQRIDTYTPGAINDTSYKQGSMIGDDKKGSFIVRNTHSLNIHSEQQLAINLMQENSFTEKPIDHIVCKRLTQENIQIINDFAERFIYLSSIKLNLKQPQNENLKPNMKNIVDYTGARYVGQMNSSHAKNGKGILINSDNSVYLGDFVVNRKHGQGIEIEKTQQRYEGTFVQGERTGYGQLFYINGDTYQGNFEKGERHGRGKQVYYESCEIFVGNFVHDKKDGKGVMHNLHTNALHEGIYREDQLLTQRLQQQQNSRRTSSQFYTLEVPSQFHLIDQAEKQNSYLENKLLNVGGGIEGSRMDDNSEFKDSNSRREINLADRQTPQNVNVSSFATLQLQQQPQYASIISSPIPENSSSCCCSLLPKSILSFFN